MSKTPELQILSNPPEVKPDIDNPEFQEFANAGMKVEETKKERQPRKRLCFEIDKDINDAIEKEIDSKRIKVSKTQWIVKAILAKLRWKNKA